MTHRLARAQAQCCLDMLDRDVGLARPEPENAAHKPAASEAGVERQRAVDQPDHRADILAEIRQRGGGINDGSGGVLPRLQRLPREIDGFGAGLLRVGPAVLDKPHVAD